MEVTCPACTARYKADATKLRGKTARMRCRTCDTVWLVSGPTTETRSAGEPARAAVVKRNAEREHRDLFASRPLDEGSVKQTLRPPPPDSQIGGMAARNEASVLFTVDALRTDNARLKTPEAEASPVSGFIVEDDEGIIDLNALASSPPKVGSRSIAPLFASEPPPAAFTADVSDSGRSVAMPGGFRLGKRAIAGIAAAAVALVLCSVGLSAAFKGEEPVARSAATMIVAPPAMTAAPPPEVAPPVVAATGAAAEASDDDAKSPSGSGKRLKPKARSGGAKASFAPAKVQSSGVPVTGTGVAKAVPKASDKCGCKGNFDCILRCTATGK